MTRMKNRTLLQRRVETLESDIRRFAREILIAQEKMEAKKAELEIVRPIMLAEKAVYDGLTVSLDMDIIEPHSDIYKPSLATALKQSNKSAIKPDDKETDWTAEFGIAPAEDWSDKF